MRHYLAACLTSLLCLAALLPACAFNQRQVNELADDLRSNPPEVTLSSLEKLNPPGRDQGQYLLNVGILQLLTGDFTASIETLQQAKILLKQMQAISISENLGAATINETLRAYQGTPGERVMVQEVLAINYLLLGDLEGARVEALQADVLMNQLTDKALLRGQLASARFTAGLIYELGGEWSDAMISYRKAAEAMQRRKQKLPRALEDSLLQASHHLGLTAEYEAYVEQFGRPAASRANDQGEIIVIYWDGIVSGMRQRTIAVYVPELEQTVSLALPYYPPANYQARHLEIEVAGNSHTTRMLEDIESLARQALDARQGEIYAMSLARMVSKYQAVHAAQRESPFAGIVANLATLFSEIADTRSWNMLPSTIQIARVTVLTGEWSIRVPDRGGAGGTRSQPVTVAPGEKVIVLASQVNQGIFSTSVEPR